MTNDSMGMGRGRPPYASRRYGIGGDGTGGTPQISGAQGN
jgi:hypothetical protein